MLNLYIDPGTGSMLFSILIGIIGVVVFFLRTAMIKIKFLLSGGKKVKIDKNKLPIVIFSDNKSYWNVFRPICEEFEKRGQKVCYYTASEQDPALKCSDDYKHVTFEFIGEGNRAYSKLNMLNAYIVLSTTPGLNVYQWKRSKTVNFYVHILHSIGHALYRMFGTDYYDALLLPGEPQAEQSRELEKLRGLPAKDIEIVGITYLDELKKRYDSRTVTDEKHDVPVVLLAPSWGESGILTKYGEPFIEELISTGYHIVVRPHPQSFTSEADMLDKLMKKYPDNDKFEWNRDNDNFDILSRADIMISDFSGVIFDFAFVFDKPVMYANAGFSKDPYDAWWLSDDPWNLKALPKLGKEISSDYKGKLKSMIDECIDDPKYSQARADIRKTAWQNIGNAAPATCDYLIKKLKELKESEG